MSAPDPAIFNAKRDEFIERLQPIFLPADPVKNDIICYFASLLRVLGMEDGGWDPYAESRGLLDDINAFFKLELPKEHFKEPHKTPWRLGLLLYSHIVEMDAPYEVLTNLLRFQLGKGYSPNPFFALLREKEQKSYARWGISTGRKIEIIKQLSKDLGFDAGDIFDEFYDNRLRNAIAHSDYIIANDDFRCRGGLSGMKAFRIPYEELDKRLVAAKAFVAAFFQVELAARQIWGLHKQKAIPYDPLYKGLMEVLVDNRDVMCGFKVHWPNGSESMYRRTEYGIDMVNCMVSPEHATLQLMVGLFPRGRGPFSPLVEQGGVPVYSKIEGIDEPPVWPDGV
jgi:hypothetical protein